jgi:hypothetical protein
MLSGSPSNALHLPNFNERNFYEEDEGALNLFPIEGNSIHHSA